MGADRIDVLAVMASFMRFSGSVVPERNTPRPTGLIANRARSRIAGPGRRVSTNTVLRALRAAELAGDVIATGTGADYANWRDQSAAEAAEVYWKLAPAALARCGESA